MTGFERNSDIVFAAAYAPVLRNIGDGIVSSTLPVSSALLIPEMR